MAAELCMVVMTSRMVDSLTMTSVSSRMDIRVSPWLELFLLLLCPLYHCNASCRP